MKQFISDYFNFTKKERAGIITLLILILFFVFLPLLFPLFIKDKQQNSTAFANEIAALQIKSLDSGKSFTNRDFDENNYQNFYQPSERNYYAGQTKGDLFYFDPNTLDEAGWKRLGLRDKTIATIKNFTSKGGKFYKPEDISKIWGLHEDEIQRLTPYIQIQNSFAQNNYEKKEYEPKTYPKYTPSIVDINASDTTAWIALPGIGGKLAQRIVTFRDKLGGFYKIEQVAETFGLPDSTFQKIKPRLVLNNPVIKKININTATLDEMKAHPYLRYATANAIVNYRLQHGNYASVNDIKKIMTITDEVFNKVVFYLTIN
ncbi:helix-hairpin-helix domain-containing protein [Ferruginibacter sp. SUN002]|uniref:helix-hairpin-helix domain-containing protein n=1 Tax=Ferruginibacter sp. SUN002 TaxID=2937789 RepID=UPI003D36A21D